MSNLEYLLNRYKDFIEKGEYTEEQAISSFSCVSGLTVNEARSMIKGTTPMLKGE